MTRRVPYLGLMLRVVLLCLTVHVCRVYGQSTSLLATSVPLSNAVFEAYFGDGQSTTAIGNRLPVCTGVTAGVANLSLRLVNNVTNQVIQQTVLTGSFGGVNWNTAQFPTLLSTLTGRYICTIFSSSIMATHTDTYQLNVVVPMNITCTFAPNLNLFYDSMNRMSCTVTGYPQPMVSWRGINQTIPESQTTQSNGTTHITSTVTFEGHEIASDAGDFVTISFTATYPPFTCTSLQNASGQMNFCYAIPKSVTYSRTLQVDGRCPAFHNASWSPSTSNIADYQTHINISCAPGHTGNSPVDVFCQANGSWTTFPNCAEVVNCPGACQDNNATCMDIPGSFECRCNRGYTGSGVTPGSCDLDRCLASPCNHASATCVNTMSSFFCQCPVSSVGVTNDACKSTVCAALCRDSNSVCQDNSGTLSCGCRVGYNGSGLSINSCNNVNECLSSPCQDCLATCSDTEGSFLCLCPAEFPGNGLKRGGCSRGGCSRAVESLGTTSAGLTAGVSCGTFLLGSIITFLITWFLAKRKYGADQSGNDHDPQVGKPPVGMAMTNSDAYGMVDVPTTQQQQPQYEYILPEAQ